MNNIIQRTGSEVTFSEEVCEKIISLEKQAKEIKKQQDTMKNEILAKNYTGENLDKLLKKNNIEKLEDIPMSKASELIGKIMKQRKAEKHD